jgi:hypothetical protein
VSSLLDDLWQQQHHHLLAQWKRLAPPMRAHPVIMRQL